MQSRGRDSPRPDDTGKRRRVEVPLAKDFAIAERGVLDLAAGILGVPLGVLLSVNLPLSEIISARLQSNPDPSSPSSTKTTNTLAASTTGRSTLSSPANTDSPSSTASSHTIRTHETLRSRKDQFSTTELGVLELAAGILKVTVEVFLSLNLLSELFSPRQSSSASPQHPVATAKEPNGGNESLSPPHNEWQPQTVASASSSAPVDQENEMPIAGQLTDLGHNDFLHGPDTSSTNFPSNSTSNVLNWDIGTAGTSNDNDFFTPADSFDPSFDATWQDFNTLSPEWMTMNLPNGAANLQDSTVFETRNVHQPVPDLSLHDAPWAMLPCEHDIGNSRPGVIAHDHVTSVIREEMIEQVVRGLELPVPTVFGPVRKPVTASRQRGAAAAGRGRRGANRSEQEKYLTNQTRRYGACAVCRVQKVLCAPGEDPDKPCLTCINRAKERAKDNLPTPPCVRVKMVEAALYEKGTHPQFIWTKRWTTMNIVEIKHWASSEIKMIRITQEVGGTAYEVPVKRVIPQDGDMFERRWYSSGSQKSHTTAPYAISDMHSMGKTIMRFVHDNVAVTVRHNLDHGDQLLTPVYLIALELRSRAATDEERQLIRNILHLWTAIRMESRSDYIIGEETLGMQPQLQDVNYRTYGKYLMPPIISAQIELVTTATVLIPFKKKVLKQLQDMITDKKKTHWFTIYLCSFILLHSCAMLTEFQYLDAIKYGRTTRYYFDDFVRELHRGAKTVLIYFHLCNLGSRPFSRPHVASFAKAAGLNEEQTTFLNATAKVVEEKKVLFQHIKDTQHVEHPYYFLSQLYEEDWLNSGSF